ncbi:MAG: class I SAM-dependent methyltransferase [Verrucomicrobiota bacterium]
MSTLTEYYGRRAREYERIYFRDDPVRLAEQETIATAMRCLFRDRRVLEIACGTGFWTEKISPVVEHLCAVDASPEMLTVARSKALPADKVEFAQEDAYALDSLPGRFNGGLANFWFSHVPKSRIDEFFTTFHARLVPGAVVFMADNVYLPGIGGELVGQPGIADTFKVRTLSDGSRHEVLKNYYAGAELKNILQRLAIDLRVRVGECFWWVSYVIA